MRSTEDQMKEILRRKGIYTKTRMLKRRITAEISVGSICLCLIVSVALMLPRLNIAQEQAPILQYGSMILSMPVIGYIVVAFLAFIMGISVALACIHWKEKNKKERDL